MGGRHNWRGSGFHADVVTARVLQDLVAQRAAAIAKAAAPPSPDYWIESAADGAGPDWDVVERRGDTRILEELKSGKVTRDDRLTIWKRVRRTIATGTLAKDVIVRLTADRDAIALKAAWSGLSTCTAVPSTPPTEEPKKATTSVHLFAEALTFLTHPTLEFGKSKKRTKARGRVVEVGAPLQLADAVALLRRFEFVADRSRAQVQHEISSALGSLKSNLTTKVLQTWLLGHFFEVAQKSGAIEATRLAEALPLVASLLDLEPDLDRLLDRVLHAAPAPGAKKRIPLLEWRTAQPAVATAIDAAISSTTGTVLALTGEAGIGKSTVLAGIFDELRASKQEVAWLVLGIDGGLPPTLAQLDRLTELLAQRCTWLRKPCWLLIDGADALPDSIPLLQARGGLRIVVAARNESYEPKRELSATQISLTRWPASEVERIMGAQLRPDLAALLGNPFLLDLALEFPSASLRRPTRFAILARYLATVVFANGVRGVSARACFDVMARELARGQHLTTPPTNGLDRLIAHGVATAPGGGRVRFAHPLFGEFAVASYSSRGDSAHTVQRFGRIRDSFTRGAALKILLEGCADATDVSQLLDLPPLATLIDASFETEVDIVGALASLDVETPDVLKHPRADEFCRRLFEAAQLIDQRSWLRSIALLDLTPAPSWATSTAHGDVLPRIADHLLACGDMLPSDVGREIALRLREWSRGQASVWASYLVKAIARFLADDDTLRWMTSLPSSDAPWLGTWLRSGLRQVCSRNSDLDRALVRDVLDRIVDADGAHLDGFEDAYNLFLAGSGSGERGLLETQPELAIDRLLDWQERETDRERRRRRSRREDFARREPTTPALEHEDTHDD